MGGLLCGLRPVGHRQGAPAPPRHHRPRRLGPPRDRLPAQPQHLLRLRHAVADLHQRPGQEHPPVRRRPLLEPEVPRALPLPSPLPRARPHRGQPEPHLPEMALPPHLRRLLEGDEPHAGAVRPDRPAHPHHHRRLRRRSARRAHLLPRPSAPRLPGRPRSPLPDRRPLGPPRHPHPERRGGRPDLRRGERPRPQRPAQGVVRLDDEGRPPPRLPREEGGLLRGRPRGRDVEARRLPGGDRRRAAHPLSQLRGPGRGHLPLRPSRDREARGGGPARPLRLRSARRPPGRGRSSGRPRGTSSIRARRSTCSATAPSITASRSPRRPRSPGR